MFRMCCVVNCGAKRKDVVLHCFPSETEIGLQKWLQCLGDHGGNIQCLSEAEVRKRFVCHKHFEKRFITKKNRLHIGAYPTLFTNNEIATGIPERASLDTENNPNTDHSNYCRKRYHDDHNYSKSILSENYKRIRTDVTITLPDASTSDYVEQVPVRVLNSQTEVMQSIYNAIEQVAIPVDSQPEAHPTTSDTAKHLSSSPGRICPQPVPGDVTLHVTTPRRRPRMRISRKINTLTPNCQRIYKEFCKSQKQLRFSRRARRAIKFNKQNSFEKMTKFLNPVAKKILWLQVRQCTRKSKGRRFTLEEKIIGLSIMKQSPRSYRFLQKIFILPSKTTLNKLVANLDIEAGINPQIFEAVKEEVDTWDANKKYCSIMFDEVALEAGLHYDKNKDRINGLVQLDDETVDEFADHALVFMVRGVLHKWQQPVAFYFCKGATSAAKLKIIIKKVVYEIISCGLFPLALICDQGTAFCSALKALQEDTRREQLKTSHPVTDGVIIINEHILNIIFDPPHLLKGVRNNFLTKNIKYNGKLSKWNDIVEIYKRDCNHAQMRLLPKLNDEHVIPEKIKKMKVKNCARVFSKSVAATLAYTAEFSQYGDGTPVSSTLKNTAEVVSFFDDLFDSVNGAAIFSKYSKGKHLRKAVTNKSVHENFWKEAREKIKKITFVDSKGKETVVPSLKNWIVTLTSFERIWQFLKEKNIKIMRPRYLNSDPIENFFGQVRAYNFRNNDPNCHSFKCTFKALLITGFIKFHSISFNCEDDAGEQLLKLKSLFKRKVPCEKSTDGSSNKEVDSLMDFSRENFDPESVVRCVSRERLNTHSRAYTAGWVVRQILNKINCNMCKKNLTSENEEAIHKWISVREYKTIKKRKLTYPAEHAVRLFTDVMQEVNEFLELKVHWKQISENIKKAVLMKNSFNFLQCKEHKNNVIHYFLGFTIRLGVFNWCNVINSILKGTDVSRLQNKMPRMQSKAYEKYKKKRIKK